MRDRTTRDEPIGGQCSNGRITVTELAVMYGLALVVPAFLWAITNPVLAAGVGAVAVGVAVIGWAGVRIVRTPTSNGTGDGSGRAGSVTGRAAE